MISEPKTLVIFDTNMIRNNLEWERDYSVFETKGSFSQIINFIKDTKLQNSISIGLPEIVIEEFVNNRFQNFNFEINNLKSGCKKLENLPSFNFPQKIISDDDFDYREFIKNKIQEFLNDTEFVNVLKLDKKLFSETLTILTQKAIKKERPFTDSGKGFKDALIWEIILNYDQIETYSSIFLLTENQNDFEDLAKKFKQKFKKNINLIPNKDILIVELEKIYGWRVKYRELLSYLHDEYFKSRLTEYLSETSLKINEFKIDSILNMSDLDPNELKEIESPELVATLSNLVKVNLIFENNTQKFSAELIIESESKEIFSVKYEEATE